MCRRLCHQLINPAWATQRANARPLAGRAYRRACHCHGHIESLGISFLHSRAGPTFLPPWSLPRDGCARRLRKTDGRTSMYQVPCRQKPLRRFVDTCVTPSRLLDAVCRDATPRLFHFFSTRGVCRNVHAALVNAPARCHFFVARLAWSVVAKLPLNNRFCDIPSQMNASLQRTRECVIVTTELSRGAICCSGTVPAIRAA
jgi:hypothetical protein